MNSPSGGGTFSSKPPNISVMNWTNLYLVDKCNQSIKLYKENSTEIKYELTKSKVKIVKINIPILGRDSANISFGLWFDMIADLYSQSTSFNGEGQSCS